MATWATTMSVLARSAPLQVRPPMWQPVAGREIAQPPHV
jgi:hypothetical protein